MKETIGRTLKELAALYATDEARHAEPQTSMEQTLRILKELDAMPDLEETQALGLKLV